MLNKCRMNNRDGSAAILQQYILGTAGLGGVWGAVDPEASAGVMINALETGITSIDTAPAYGDAEVFVGKVLQQWRGRRPKVSTKVGRLKSYASDQGTYDYTPAGMTKSVERSLKTLGVPVIDVLFLHEPAAIPPSAIAPAVDKMIAFKEEGYAREIGLGGNYPSSFQKYLNAGVFDVVMEYNRLNACCIDALDTSLPACRDNAVAYWAASPLHMGLLGRRFQEFVQSRPEWLEQRFINTASGIRQMAAENGILLPELALRFMQTVPSPLNIVIGPVTQNEFSDCITAVLEGPLEDQLYTRILNYIKHKLNIEP